MKKQIVRLEPVKRATNRRQFLKIGGLDVVGAGLFIACSNGNDGYMPPVTPPPNSIFDLGSGDLDVLNYAYALEQLEADFYTLEDEFYDLTLQSGVLPSGRPGTVYIQISKHEQANVDFLIAGLEDAGVTPVSKPTFDFTAGGAFDPFNENGIGQETAYAQLLAVVQLGSPFLTAALQIHSVEALHASEIRRLRGLKGWITNNERGAGIPEATQAVYDGEENITQGGLNVTTLGSGSPFTMEAASEAYDEPISGETAVAIASLFIVTT